MYSMLDCDLLAVRPTPSLADGDLGILPLVCDHLLSSSMRLENELQAALPLALAFITSFSS
jgi:hypothetical protein